MEKQFIYRTKNISFGIPRNFPEANPPDLYAIDYVTRMMDHVNYIVITLIQMKEESFEISNFLFIPEHQYPKYFPSLYGGLFHITYNELSDKYFCHELHLKVKSLIALEEIQSDFDVGKALIFIQDTKTKFCRRVESISLDPITKISCNGLERQRKNILDRPFEETKGNTNYIDGGYDIDDAFGGEAEAYWSID